MSKWSSHRRRTGPPGCGLKGGRVWSAKLFAILLITFHVWPPAPCAADDLRPDLDRVYRETGADTLRAFVFLPPKQDSVQQANAILLFHGGGWSSGSAEWTFPAARRFAEAGLVAIAFEYRLARGEVTPIEALDDACSAVAWTRARSEEFGLSGRIAGYGVSAGGHLITAAATLGCQDGDANLEALLLWSPALDLVNDRWFVGLLQGRATATELSPARHVGSTTPPTSIVHGELDTLTPLRGVERYCAALQEVGGICDLHAYPGVGHLLTRNLKNQESDFDPDPEARSDGIARHLLFLESLGFLDAPKAR